jgi:N-acetylmuramoyl-L-alanine amidase
MEKYVFIIICVFIVLIGCSITPPDEFYPMNGQSANESSQSGYIWTQLEGRLKQISVGNANHVWGVNGTNAIYRWTGSAWIQVDGTLKQVSIGNDGDVWGVTVNDDIYRRTGNTWIQISGKLKQISVGNANNVWGVNDSNAIYRWTGSGWIQVAGKLKYVSVGNDGDVWGINLQADIYRRTGTTWTQIPGKLTQISVGNAHNVWGVNGSNAIYRWTGSGWSQVDGALKCVSVGNDGDVWGINVYNDIYHRIAETPPVTTPEPTPYDISNPTPEPTPDLHPTVGPYILEARGGVLSGKTIYLSAGHGKYWKDNSWHTERQKEDNAITYLEEDIDTARFINEEVIPLLEAAGANVWTFRERDTNRKCEIIHAPDMYPPDAWATVTPEPGKTYMGTCYQTHTHIMSGVPIDTATAVWTFNTRNDLRTGDYALYVWYPMDSGQTGDAYYAIKHGEGITTLTLNQSIHGSAWRYMGTFPVRQTEQFIVTLGNHSCNSNRKVTASAMRLGGGTIDDLSGFWTDHNAAGNPVPGPDPPMWWEANAWYNLQRAYQTDLQYYRLYNMYATEGLGDASIRGSWAYWQWKSSGGEDAIYISWHTNGFTEQGVKERRGTNSYVHYLRQDEKPYTDLQEKIHGELMKDIRAYYETDWNRWSGYEYGDVPDEWFHRGATPSDAAWGELSPQGDELPSILIEIAYHDNYYDLIAISDTYFRRIVARALCNGIIRYFKGDNASLQIPLPHDFSTVQPYNTIQCRVQRNITDPWDITKTITSGNIIRIGTMHDNSGYFAENRFIMQKVTAPDGKTVYYPQVGEEITPTLKGIYQVVSKTTRAPFLTDVASFTVQ